MKTCLVLSIIFLALSAPAVNAACAGAGDVAAGKGCCCAANGSSVIKAAGVDACTVTCGTSEVDATATSCLINYYLSSGACAACAQGKTAPAGSSAASACTPCVQDQVSLAAGAACTDPTANAAAANGIASGCRVFALADKSTCAIAKNGWVLTTATAVDPCPAGQYSTDGSACAAVTAGTTVAGCRSYSALAGTLANCVVAVDGYSLVGGVITLCSQDQFSSGGAACAAITSGVTGVTNCKVYSTAAATKCVIPKPGFFLNAAGTTATACISGCDECTDATLAGCTKAAVGKYLKNPGASQTIEPCGDNCNTCTAPVAPATTPACTATKAGYKLVSGAPVACGAGEGSPDNNTAATCTACTATQVVVKGSCVARCDAATLGADYLTYGNKCCFATATNSALVGVGVATCATPVPTAVGEYNAATCSAGFFLNNGACEKVCSATTADAAAYGTNGGMKCCSKDKDNNLKGKGVNTCPPADPAQFTAAGEVSALGCNENFYLSGGACVACAAEKFSVVNSTTADACQTKDKVPAGAYYDETAQTFVQCTAPCANCSGKDKCTSCIVNVPDFKEPAEADANYNTLLKTYQFDNVTSTCLKQCADGFAVSDVKTRTACVQSGSAAGVLAIILSICSMIIILL